MIKQKHVLLQKKKPILVTGIGASYDVGFFPVLPVLEMKRALPAPSQPVPLDAPLDPSIPALKTYRVGMRSVASVGGEWGCVSFPVNFFNVTPSFPRARCWCRTEAAGGAPVSVTP